MITLSAVLALKLMKARPDACVSDLEIVTNHIVKRLDHSTVHLVVFQDLQQGTYYGFHYYWPLNGKLHRSDVRTTHSVVNPYTDELMEVQASPVRFEFEPRPKYILEDT